MYKKISRIKKTSFVLRATGLLSDQRGQTLMETIGAIFILTMALSTALGLAIYSFSRSNISEKQVVAVNLAREGIDAVRMMRDTNWLEEHENLDADCGSGGAQNAVEEDPMDNKACYPDWLDSEYDISPSNNGDDFRLIFNADSKEWELDTRNGIENFHLCLENGRYSHVSSIPCNTNPPFARRVSITAASINAPYTPMNPQILIQSAVIWSDKNCPSIVGQDPIAFVTPCKILTQEYLTNWKDYE